MQYSERKKSGKIYRLIYKSIKNYRFLKTICEFISKQKPVSWIICSLFGPYHERSRTKIEIDITYSCNLKCINCNRLCRQAPSEECMNVAQLKKFISESKRVNIKWKTISIVGGEPTLHPDLFEIVRLLLEYKNVYSPDCEVVLFTNGFGEETRRVLTILPKELIIRNSGKKNYRQLHMPVNMAPADLKRYSFVDYSIGCAVIQDCGIGLTPYGYYPCPTAGALDRVLGFDKGRKSIPLKNDSMRDLLKIFCPYCGLFTHIKTYKEIITPIWLKTLRQYALKKPQLSKY